MYNWSVNEKKLKKNKKKYAIWKLEQMINFGLNGGKISKKELKKYWLEINIDPFRREFLKLIIDEKRGLKQKSTRDPARRLGK